MHEKGSEDKKSVYQDLAASSLGIEVAVATLLGALLGYYLDRHFHTKPWLLLACLIGGAIIGWVDVWVQIRAMRIRDEEEAARKKEEAAKKGDDAPA